MSTNSSKSGGISLLGLVFVLFLGLKLCKVIDWSWWYVFMPLYAIPAILLALWLFGALLVGIGTLLEGKRKR